MAGVPKRLRYPVRASPAGDGSGVGAGSGSDVGPRCSMSSSPHPSFVRLHSCATAIWTEAPCRPRLDRTGRIHVRGAEAAWAGKVPRSTVLRLAPDTRKPRAFLINRHTEPIRHRPFGGGQPDATGACLRFRLAA